MSSPPPLSPEVYGDATWSAAPHDRYALAITFNRLLIRYQVKVARTVADCSMSAEMHPTTEGGMQAEYLHEICRAMGMPLVDPVVVATDSLSNALVSRRQGTTDSEGAPSAAPVASAHGSDRARNCQGRSPSGCTDACRFPDQVGHQEEGRGLRRISDQRAQPRAPSFGGQIDLLPPPSSRGKREGAWPRAHAWLLGHGHLPGDQSRA